MFLIIKSQMTSLSMENELMTAHSKDSHCGIQAMSAKAVTSQDAQNVMQQEHALNAMRVKDST